MRLRAPFVSQIPSPAKPKPPKLGVGPRILTFFRILAGIRDSSALPGGSFLRPSRLFGRSSKRFANRCEWRMAFGLEKLAANAGAARSNKEPPCGGCGRVAHGEAPKAPVHGLFFRSTTRVSSLLTQARCEAIRSHHILVVDAAGWPMVKSGKRRLMDFPSARRQECRRSLPPLRSRNLRIENRP
jgi:hypothetical protein